MTGKRTRRAQLRLQDAWRRGPWFPSALRVTGDTFLANVIPIVYALTQRLQEIVDAQRAKENDTETR